jgi:hypothetical protein
MMNPLFQLLLARDGTVQIVTEHGTHLYLPDCKAGKILAVGPRDVLESWRRHFARFGYETRLVGYDPGPVTVTRCPVW